MLQRHALRHRWGHQGRPRPVHTKAAAVGGGGGSSNNSGKRYRLRQARVEDAASVSEVMAEVFGAGNFAGSGVEDSAFIQELEAAYSAAVSREGDCKLAEALLNKEEAALADRAYRMHREAALLRAQLAMAKGQPAVWPTEGPNEIRQLSKWRRTRKFVCLLVEEVDAAAAAAAEQSSASSSSSSWGGDSSSEPSSSGRVVATATLSMMQAEAALPPPFPSNAPMRAYISNMAVSPAARRQGLGKTLCTACGRIAKAWGEPCVLLHVAADNTTAQQLYQSCGFVPVSNSQGFSGIIKGPWTQQRMVVDSAQLAAGYRQLAGSSSGGSSSSRSTGPVRWQQVQA